MRTLSKYHSSLDITQSGPNNYDLTAVAQVGANNGWEKIVGQIFVSENYFDLAGLAMDEKTIYPAGITVQRGNVPTFDGAVPGDNILILDVITSIPIDVDWERLMGGSKSAGILDYPEQFALSIIRPNLMVSVFDKYIGRMTAA